MVEAIVTLLQTLNTLSPLAIIGLLSVIIYVIVWKQPTKREFSRELNVIKSNDLHELPEMAESLRRIELMLADNFSYIRAKLNGEKR